MPSYLRKVQVPGKTAQELYEKVSTEIDRFLSKTPIGKFTLASDPAQKQVTFKASMASGTLICRDGELELDANLSIMALPFRSKIDEGIDRWVAKTFA